MFQSASSNSISDLKNAMAKIIYTLRLSYCTRLKIFHDFVLSTLNALPQINKVYFLLSYANRNTNWEWSLEQLPNWKANNHPLKGRYIES